MEKEHPNNTLFGLKAIQNQLLYSFLRGVHIPSVCVISLTIKGVDMNQVNGELHEVLQPSNGVADGVSPRHPLSL